MCKVFQADLSVDKQRVQELFTELSKYLWNNFNQRFGVGTETDTVNLVTKWMAEIQEFIPPNGCLMVAEVDNLIVGVGGIRTIGQGIGEIKHFYVHPQFRRRGLGRELLKNLEGKSISMGHTTLRLDTGWFMEAAQALYHSVGFKDIDPYPGTEVPEEVHPYWIFMEKDLKLQT